MATYRLADNGFCDHVRRVMGQYHLGLSHAEVRVCCLYAYPATDANGDAVGHAVRCGGYPAIATIRILSLRDRVARNYDAELVIDADWLEQASEAEVAAVIDHELTHLELVTDDANRVLRDDAERPRLRIRKHDRQFGWFDVVAARHGEHSQEVQQCQRMMEPDEVRQLYLPFMAEVG